jgi:phospholipid/cholesterol/gamma-HCH transport system substrate-binding protein
MSEKASTVVAPPARGKNQELWVGVFVIIGMLVTFYLLLTLTDAAMFRGRYIVSSVVSDASGVRKGDPVQMRGVGIGRVQKFVIAGSGVRLYLEIEGEYATIPTDSHVELVSAGLLGGMVVRVIPGPGHEMAGNGAVLSGEIPTSIQDQATEIAGATKTTLDRVQALLTEAMVKDTHTSARELAGLLKTLSSIATEQQKQLKTLTASMNAAALNVQSATSREEIDRAMKRLDSISASAERTADTAETSTKLLDEVLGRIQRGEGTLGKLSKDDALYTNLNHTLESVNATSVEMKNLLADLRANPKRYLKVSVF